MRVIQQSELKMVVQTETVTNGPVAMDEAGGENMAAWICGMNDLKVQPFKLPPVLGALLFLCSFSLRL